MGGRERSVGHGGPATTALWVAVDTRRLRLPLPQARATLPLPSPRTRPRPPRPTVGDPTRQIDDKNPKIVHHNCSVERPGSICTPQVSHKASVRVPLTRAMAGMSEDGHRKDLEDSAACNGGATEDNSEGSHNTRQGHDTGADSGVAEVEDSCGRGATGAGVAVRVEVVVGLA